MHLTLKFVLWTVIYNGNPICIGVQHWPFEHYPSTAWQIQRPKGYDLTGFFTGSHDVLNFCLKA